ncbi:MAG: hypothetical protein U1D30_18070 [Planctomycetota bacterium]
MLRKMFVGLALSSLLVVGCGPKADAPKAEEKPAAAEGAAPAAPEAPAAPTEEKKEG